MKKSMQMSKTEATLVHFALQILMDDETTPMSKKKIIAGLHGKLDGAFFQD